MQPRDLRHAMELCIDYARERHNRSVDHVAELMSEVNKWTLYKWLEGGNMPARKIPAFEHACGIDFVSRWFASRGNRVVIEIPIGRKVNAEDLNVLQGVLNEAFGALLKFYGDKLTPEETHAAVSTAVEQLVWHRLNVDKCRQPELPMFEEE
jgi:hypothetical protein